MVVTLHPGLLVNEPVNLVFFSCLGGDLYGGVNICLKKKSGISFFSNLKVTQNGNI